MNARCAWITGMVLLCSSSPAAPQRSPGGIRSVQTLERKAALERDSSELGPARVSVAELASQADELSQLGQSIPTGIEQTPQSVKPADLSRKLKRIEKLSRCLRDAIGPDPLR